MSIKSNDIKNVYFLGVGGIGMSAIARYYLHEEKRVAGYDRTSSPLIEELVKEGVEVHFDDDTKMIPSDFSVENTLVVFTPAIPKDHKEKMWLESQGYTIRKRAQVLGLIAEDLKCIGVAGTHGKTSVSTMLSHILKQSSVGCNAFLGGISNNYGSNFMFDKSSEWMVAEADEFDRSFLNLFPTMALITSMDADHLDIYGDHSTMKESFRDFLSQTKRDGVCVVKKGLDIHPDVNSGATFYSYSLKEEADYYGRHIRVEEGSYVFDLVTPDRTISGIRLSYPGLVNVENAIAASALALMAGVEEDELRSALACYDGVKRRFDYHVKEPKVVYIDDYAHHPEELKATISSVRDLYPDRRITGIFQPHLFTRTRDFVDGFAESLSMLDELLLMDIYPARELPIEGVTSKIIFDKVTDTDKFMVRAEEVPGWLKLNDVDVLLTLGAGDIDRLVPVITQILKQKI
ncbi:UDP-N-acetylmuramate--L-alanine ligase [Puteibacter caeruleilacunae]|nr:UDP-N-acetylmuramate--L-alanine ligase [Puteibacter caeruleilacunae]